MTARLIKWRYYELFKHSKPLPAQEPVVISTPFDTGTTPVGGSPLEYGGYRGYPIYFQVGTGYFSTVNGEYLVNLDLVELKRRIDLILDNPPVIEPPQPPAVDKAIFNGINYVGKYWNYSDKPLNDLSLLKSLGVEWISLHVAWNVFEPIKDQYNNGYAEILTQISKAARNMGIKVMLDNHYFGQGHYSSPSWTPTQTDFVNFIQRLNSSIPHDIISVANETHSSVPLSWIQAAHQVSGLSTVRCDYSTFTFLKSVLPLYDVISLNYYKKYVTPQQLLEVKTFAGSKPFWITEMGSQQLKDADQLADYQSQKVLFTSVNPAVVMPWIWEDPVSGPSTLSWSIKSNIAPGYRPALVGHL